MAQVVCHVVNESHFIHFTWSQGGASFPTYTLTGQGLKDFRLAAQEARERLRALVSQFQYKDASDVILQISFELAQEGYRLYRLLFSPGGEETNQRTAQSVKKWLAELSDHSEIESLEIVIEGPRIVPWNALYESRPRQDHFLGDKYNPSRWEPFWGIRYNLGGGRPVEPLRRLPFWQKPRVLLVCCPLVQGEMPKKEKQRLKRFLTSQQVEHVQSKAQLEEALSENRPDLIYFLCHATPDYLQLGGEEITPSELGWMLEGDNPHERTVGGIVFLNACQTAQNSDDSSFVDALYERGCGGLIATEEQTIDTFANPFGIVFLRQFLAGKETVGKILHKLRHNVPLGLLYGAYCPPEIKVILPPKKTKQDQIVEILEQRGGRLLTSGNGSQPEQVLPLPERPYRALLFYTGKERALFVGRDSDAQRFAQLLGEVDTRILILHGESGVGKTSFLRAGVIPYLEEDCIGYRFARDPRGVDSSSILFVRATNDLPGQLAQALCAFCARPYGYQTPQDKTIRIDLSKIVQNETRKNLHPHELRKALISDPELLGRLLSSLSSALPFSLVLTIDQVEEVFTLAQTQQDEQNRHCALEMLRLLSRQSGHFKVIVSLRTEYYGRLIDQLRHGPQDRVTIREYLLTDVSQKTLEQILLRPTSKERIPYAAEIPFEKYHFQYEEGLAEELASTVLDHSRNRQDSALPLAQVLCSQLYERVKNNPNAIITQHDLKRIGGVAGGMKSHVEALIKQLFARSKDREAMKELMTKLYLQQPDGTLTTALVPKEELMRLWRGSMPFEEMYKTASRTEIWLFRISRIRKEGEEEIEHVSLGHDALATVAADWDRELTRKRQLRKRTWVAGGMTAVATIMAFLTLFAWKQAQEAREARSRAEDLRKEAEFQEQLARKRLYLARIGQAHDKYNSGHIELGRILLESTQKEFRNWEYGYLSRLLYKPETTYFGHTGSVSSVVYSPNGKLIASASHDTTVKVWNAVTGEQALTFKGHTGWVNSVAFTPDGKRIVSGSNDRTVKVWDATTGQQLLTLKGHTDIVWSTVFSPDGRRIVSGSEDRTVRVWKMGTVPESMTLRGHTDRVYSVAFNHDGTRIVSGSKDQTVRVWKMGTVPESMTLRGHTDLVYSVAFNHDGTRIVSSSKDQTVRVWDAITGSETLTLKGHTGWVYNVAYNRDGSRIVSAGDKTVKVWDAHTGEQVHSLKGHSSSVSGATFSPSGKHIVSGSWDTTLKVWDALSGEQARSLEGHSGSVTSVVFSPDGGYIASGSWDKTVRVWDTKTGERAHALEGHTAPVFSVAFSPDGKRVASGSEDKTVRVWNAHTGKQAHVLKGHSGSVTSVAFSPDGKRVASAGQDETVRVWNAHTGEQAHVLEGHTGWVYSVAFSPDGKRVVSGSEDKTVRVWDAITKEEILTFQGHTGWVNSVCFSPDGNRVVSGSGDDTVRVWDAGIGEQALTLKGHTLPVLSVAFSPDGKRVISGGIDKTVKMWNATPTDSKDMN